MIAKTTFRITLVMIGLASSRADLVFAQGIVVEPTRVFMTSGQTSEIVTLTNENDRPTRFQISVRAWNQSRSGETELAETKDLVFFPRLVEIPARQASRVRVGWVGGEPGEAERSYRIFFEELPVAESREVTGVRVLAKIGVPVFVQPKAVRRSAEVEGVEVERSTLRFAFLNRGNVFEFLRGVRVIGRDSEGSELFDRQASGWYVLAGGARDYEMKLDATECDRLHSVEIIATTGNGEASDHSVVREVSADCAPSS